jgi:methyl-accepting chemotaxis protein
MKMVKMGFTTVLGMLIIISLILLWSQTSIKSSFEELSHHEYTLDELNMKANILMLQCRRNEKDFILRNDLKYLEKHKKNITKTKDALTEFSKIAKDAHYEDLSSSAINILKSVDLYATSFGKLVEAQKKKGLTYKDGLQGEFRNLAHKMMDKITIKLTLYFFCIA